MFSTEHNKPFRWLSALSCSEPYIFPHHTYTDYTLSNWRQLWPIFTAMVTGTEGYPSLFPPSPRVPCSCRPLSVPLHVTWPVHPPPPPPHRAATPHIPSEQMDWMRQLIICSVSHVSVALPLSASCASLFTSPAIKEAHGASSLEWIYHNIPCFRLWA